MLTKENTTNICICEPVRWFTGRKKGGRKGGKGKEEGGEGRDKREGEREEGRNNKKLNYYR